MDAVSELLGDPRAARTVLRERGRSGRCTHDPAGGIRNRRHGARFAIDRRDERARLPTRDHATAARSKNYRWSCNAQVLLRKRDLRVVATSAVGAGNRNDPIQRSRYFTNLCIELRDNP